MQALLITALLLTSPVFAQSVNLATFKSLLTERGAKLEQIKAGMSKEMITTGTIATNAGACNYRETARQSILKIEGDKLIVLSRERFQPAATEACAKAGYKSVSENILFYQMKPTLLNFLADLDLSAAAIKNLARQGELVVMSMNIEGVDAQGQPQNEELVIKYDLSKSAFRNVIQQQGRDFTTTTQDTADIDPKSADLTNVLFCADNSGDTTECVQGNFSDILY